MKLTDFHYTLPETSIAYYPTDKRTDSRLMVVQEESLSHQHFSEILSLFKPGDCLVLNDTKVMRARLWGHKTTGGRIEVLIERVLNDHEVLAHVRSSKSPKPGTDIICEESLIFTVTGRADDLFKLTLKNKESIFDCLERYGHIPLPPYIARSSDAHDAERYQTIYAKELGSVAAPTAGLHFDRDLLQAIQAKGVEVVYVTLHVGAGTFAPVRAERIEDHVIHSECAYISAQACQRINAAKMRGGRVIAVGTTSTRVLESASQSGVLCPYAGETQIFIYPGFKFQCVDAMITNFHLPESSLLMLVSAFAGYDRIMHAYHVAIAENYRFYSYGDAMWLTRMS